ncbi:GNAT family N-acetyltransferase [Falsibacillus pallidus]|uniref:Acetyltransferase (GNAT) family protein n=1 Tax=Falsibacillus pallidus TaxID=493781 RepID=A0A370GPP2_9BACI|nr:GNAT family N-acetyltransferase [Falsibacillus pallidus]RDI45692.1 acetyltransferase (GNAT) family protein [Falsibacillus pallidus]
MEKLEFARGYQKDRVLRQSFNQLAEMTFGIQFEYWFEKGYWTSKYEPFSFHVDGKIVANVSVNHLEWMVNGESFKTIQIGTVMTHPDYRGEGLSRKLMEKVLEEYDSNVDWMYLFANNSVLDFYPKFGFKAVTESLFHIPFKGIDSNKAVKKLSLQDESFVYQFVSERNTVSSQFGTRGTAELFMFYYLNGFGSDVYFIEEENVMAVYQIHEDELHLFDLVSKAPVSYKRIFKIVATPDVNEIILHFTPEDVDLPWQTNHFNGSEQLFIRSGKLDKLPKSIKHHLFSQA